MSERVDVLKTSDVWPRDDDHRYRIYSRERDDVRCLAAAPTPQALGLALVTIMEEHIDAGFPPFRVGVLDAGRGRWLTSLWEPSPWITVNRSDNTPASG